MQPALVKYGSHDGDVEIREMPLPQMRSDRVRLRVDAAGVCGSDLHMWRHHHSWAIKLPLVLGHEFCGVIEEVGDDVQGFEVGQRVACETAAEVCHRCNYCLSGNYNLCPQRLGYGALIDGAFTEQVVVRPRDSPPRPRQCTVGTRGTDRADLCRVQRGRRQNPDQPR